MKSVKLIILFNILAILMLLSCTRHLTLVSPSLEFTSEVDNDASILILYENAFDFSLVKNITENFNSTTYDVMALNTIPNINNFFVSTNLSSYEDIVLIFSSEIQNMNSTAFEKVTEASNSGTSFTIVSSKIWQLPQEGLDFFGIVPTIGSQKEFNPAQSETFTLTIKNLSFFNTLPQYNLDQEIQSSSNIAIINSTDNHSVKVISSSQVPLSQNKTGESGIFIKQNSFSKGLIATIPISIRDSNDQNSFLLLSSVIHNIIHYTSNTPTQNSTSDSTSIVDSSTPEMAINTVNANQIITADSGFVSGVVLLSSIVVTGYVSYKILPKVITKKEDEVLDDAESETWSISQPFYVPLLALIIGILAFFRATLYSKKFNRLTAFQVNENPVRRNIIEILEFSGYEHFNSLQKKLNIGVSILLWHLEVLEDFNIVATEKFGQYRVVFLANDPPNPDEVQFYCNIRSKIAFDIIKLFLDKYSWTTDTLATLLYSSNDLIKYHCRKLQKLEILHFNESTKVFSLNIIHISSLQNILIKHPDV